MNGKLPLWTVYENPSDFPGKFVARKHLVVNGKSITTDHCIVEDDLDAVRWRLVGEIGLSFCMHRDPMDDPVILETWV